jgi:predicted dehydrogenase
MTAPYRGVLIGCGFFARNHMQGWAAQKDVTIVGVCDLDPQKAAGFGRDFGVAGVYTDAAAMLAELRPDFVDIATTVASHRALVELALQQARVVICQKPFAETLADAAAMCAGATNGKALIIHENFRWQKPFVALRAALSEGQIGTPRFLRLSFRHAFDIYANQPYLAEVPDLALTDIGLHLFDLARFLMGDVARLSCETQRRNARVAGQDAFTATLRHTSGAVSSVDASFHTRLSPDPFPETLATVEGDDGTLELTQGYRLRLHRDGRMTETDVEPAVPAWGAKPWHGIQDSVLAFEAHVVDVLAGRAAPQPSGQHNLETLAVTLAAIQSARTGQTVTMAGFSEGSPA